MIKVSIITPAFKAAETIPYTAASILKQSYPHWEWIIASDDGVDYVEFLHSLGIHDPRIRSTSTGRVGAGSAVASNAALAIAQGEIGALVDNDDAFVPHKLERLIPHVIAHGAATSDILVIESSTGRELPSLNRKFPAGVLPVQDYFTANLHSYSMLLWDRRRASPRWDETVPFIPDLIFGACIFNSLPGVYYDPEPLHLYYKHPASMTNSLAGDYIIGAYRTLIARMEKGELPVTDPKARDALLRYLRRFLVMEEKFFAEPVADSSMGFYHFVARNLDAFYFW